MALRELDAVDEINNPIETARVAKSGETIRLSNTTAGNGRLVISDWKYTSGTDITIKSVYIAVPENKWAPSKPILSTGAKNSTRRTPCSRGLAMARVALVITYKSVTVAVIDNGIKKGRCRIKRPLFATKLVALKT